MGGIDVCKGSIRRGELLFISFEGVHGCELVIGVKDYAHTIIFLSNDNTCGGDPYFSTADSTERIQRENKFQFFQIFIVYMEVNLNL